MAEKRKGGGGASAKGSKKKKKADDYEDGERGFLVTGLTCQDALRGAKDWRLWLEVEAPEPDRAAEAARPAPSASAGLEEELAQLQAGGDAAAASSRRFLSKGMVCKETAYLRSQGEDVPSSLAGRFLARGAARLFESRFAERVLPVDASSRPKAEPFKALARDLLHAHRGRKWRLVFEQFRGGWNTISQDDALTACKEALGGEHMDVSDPQITVLCTVIPRFVGLAVLEMDADELQVGDGDGE